LVVGWQGDFFYLPGLLGFELCFTGSVRITTLVFVGIYVFRIFFLLSCSDEESFF
jgi:hypothetical protein